MKSRSHSWTTSSAWARPYGCAVGVVADRTSPAESKSGAGRQCCPHLPHVSRSDPQRSVSSPACSALPADRIGGYLVMGPGSARRGLPLCTAVPKDHGAQWQSFIDGSESRRTTRPACRATQQHPQLQTIGCTADRPASDRDPSAHASGTITLSHNCYRGGTPQPGDPSSGYSPNGLIVSMR